MSNTCKHGWTPLCPDCSLERVAALEAENAGLKAELAKRMTLQQLHTLNGELRAKLERAEKALKDFGEHYPECVCFGDKTKHAADCKNCDCGLLDEIEACNGMDSRQGEVDILRARLWRAEKALEHIKSGCTIPIAEARRYFEDKSNATD
jgi:hypothetical protein